MQLQPLTGPGAVAPLVLELHAFLAPSAAPRWEACPGSALMESLFPDLGDDTKSREGTACHWVMLQVLTATPPPTNAVAPNGVLVTREMFAAVDELQADIIRRLGPNWRSMIVVERRVEIPRVNAKCWGTPDVRAWAELPNGRRKLFIWDLKYGFKQIEVFECLQLVAYAAGCLSEMNDTSRVFNQPAFSETRVDCELVIVQPRAYHPKGTVRVWEIAADGLRPYVHRMAMAADEALGPTPVCKPAPEPCENCRARSGCEALQKAIYRCMDIAQQATPRELSDEAAGLELALLDDVEGLIKARKSGLEEVVKHRLQQGRRVAHWYFGPGQGKTAWTKSDAEVIALGNMLELKLAKPPEAITPIQAIKAGLPQSMADQYSATLAGATKLTRADGTEIRRIFSNAK